MDTEQEALAKMIEDGFDEIYLQPLHIMPGYEYEKIERAVARAKHHYKGKLLLGEPLLYTEEDYEAVVDALDKELSLLSDSEAIDQWLLMGHGTHHPANATYSCLQLHFEMQNKNMRVAALESFPNLEHSMPYMDKTSKWGIIPFMLVAGDHAQNDMAGPDDDSWVNVLRSEAYQVSPVVTGLGALEHFRALFVNKVEKVVRRGESSAV
jgi:sirohydrochlorin cobaltochelatase